MVSYEAALGLLLLDGAPEPPRLDSTETKALLELADRNAAHRWWGPSISLLAALVLFVVASALIRRKVRGAAALRIGAMSVGAASLVIMAVFASKPYIEKPEVPQNAEVFETGCSDYRDGKALFTHGRFGGAVLRVPIGEPIVLMVDNYRTSTCSFRIPALSIELTIPPGEMRYVNLKVNEPMTTRIFMDGGSADEQHFLHAVSSEDLFQDFLEERVRSTQIHKKHWGQLLYEDRHCNKCHSISTGQASPQPGPSFVDLYGSVVELSDGTKSAVDPDFVEWALLSPDRAHDIRFSPVDHYFADEVRERDLVYIEQFMRDLSTLTPRLKNMRQGPPGWR